MSENLQKNRFLMGRMPDPSRKRLVILTGARQTGKTTLVKAVYPDLRYVNLDAPENREAVRSIASASCWIAKMKRRVARRLTSSNGEACRDSCP